MAAIFHQKRVGFGVVFAIGVCALIPGCCLFKKEKSSNPFNGPAPVPVESPAIADTTCPANTVNSPAALNSSSNCPVNGAVNCPVNGAVSTGPVTYPMPPAPISQPAPVAPSGSQPASVSVIIPENETVPGGSVTDNKAVAKDSMADSLTDSPTDSPADSPIRPVGAIEGEASISDGSYHTPEDGGKGGESEDILLSDPQSDADRGPKSMEKSELPSGFNDYSDSRDAHSPYHNVSRPATDAPATQTPANDTVNTPRAPIQSENGAADDAKTANSTGNSSQILTTGGVEIPVAKRTAVEKSGSLNLLPHSNRAQFRVVAE